MADRRVTRTGKDRDGDITSLCDSGQYWSPRLKADAIRDIESGVHSYYTIVRNQRANVIVVNGPRGKHLRTDKDTTMHNNLDDLPNC
jgi:hypothetical protein